MPLHSGEKRNITFPIWKELGSVPAWRFLGTLRAALSIQAFWECSVRVRSSGPGVGRFGGSQVWEILFQGSSAPPPAVFTAWRRDPRPGHQEPVTAAGQHSAK